VTLLDVAKRAGVSIATVSYVMNDRGGVGDQTRANVLRIAEELGFRPNRVASGLRTGRTQVLGLVLADITNPFYPEIAGGVIAAAAEAGFQVFLSHGGTDGGLDGEVVQALCDHQCGAVIFTSLVVSDGPLLADVVPHDMPIVQTVRRIPGIHADFVGIDDRAGAREAAQHLVELGHRDLAVLAGPSTSSASSERTAGFLETLAEAGIEPHSVLECSLTLEAGHRAAQELLDSKMPVVIAGDYNVVPTDGVEDIYNPRSWKNDALLQPAPREAYARLLKQGWTDAIHKLHPGEPIYTFWDYMRNRWPRDAGLRIDHLLLSKGLAKKLVDAGVDKHVRGREGASDHAPAWVMLKEP